MGDDFAVIGNGVLEVEGISGTDLTVTINIYKTSILFVNCDAQFAAAVADGVGCGT